MIEFFEITGKWPNDLDRKEPIFGIDQNPVAPCLTFLTCSITPVEIQTSGTMEQKNMPGASQHLRAAGFGAACEERFAQNCEVWAEKGTEAESTGGHRGNQMRNCAASAADAAKRKAGAAVSSSGPAKQAKHARQDEDLGVPEHLIERRVSGRSRKSSASFDPAAEARKPQWSK